jgi:hypothetical protein
VNTVLGLAEAVEQGLGIGHLPCFIADRRPGLVRLGSPIPEFAADLWLLTHPDLRHSPRVRVFLDFLATEVAKKRKFIEGVEAGPKAAVKAGAADPSADALPDARALLSRRNVGLRHNNRIHPRSGSLRSTSL